MCTKDADGGAGASDDAKGTDVLLGERVLDGAQHGTDTSDNEGALDTLAQGIAALETSGIRHWRGACVVVSGEVGGSGVVLASGALPGVGFERERRAAVMSGGGRTRVGLDVCYQGCVNVINEDAICGIP